MGGKGANKLGLISLDFQILMSIFVSKFALGSKVSHLSRVWQLLLRCCVMVCLVVGLWMGTSAEVSAETTGELFKAQCAGCHPNGANIIRRGKNLKQKALKRYGYESADAIATLITNGKGLMSAYRDRLSEDEIASLADYVLEQSAIDWKPAK